MRRSLVALTAGLLLALAAVMPATAAEMCESGVDFGAMHSDHAQAGMLGAGMNPGMHEGFAVCLE